MTTLSSMDISDTLRACGADGVTIDAFADALASTLGKHFAKDVFRRQATAQVQNPYDLAARRIRTACSEALAHQGRLSGEEREKILLVDSTVRA